MAIPHQGKAFGLITLNLFGASCGPAQLPIIRTAKDAVEDQQTINIDMMLQINPETCRPALHPVRRAQRALWRTLGRLP